MKARISIDLDLSEFPPHDLSTALDLVREKLTAPARKTHLSALQETRMDQGGDADQKGRDMTARLLAIKLTMVAEANLRVEQLPDDFHISHDL